MFRLVPVIERPWGTHAFWLPLPREPWPTFVELSEQTSADHVVLALLTLSTYGEGPEPLTSPGELGRRFPRVAPGGLALTDGVSTVFPSCCCGLEEWTEWRGLLESGATPWLGHDPAPWVETRGDELHVWSDGAFAPADGSKPPAAPSLVVRRDDFARALDAVPAQLEGFARRIAATLREHGVREADAIARRFRSSFVDPS